MANPIAEGDVPIGYWARFVVSDKHGEVETSMNGQNELALIEIDEGRPILNLSGAGGKIELFFDDAKEMDELGKWLQNQAELIEGWNEYHTQLMEKAEGKEDTNEYYRENKVGVEEWWNSEE